MSPFGRARAWAAALCAALLAHGVALAWLAPSCEPSGRPGETGPLGPSAGVRLALRASPSPEPGPDRHEMVSTEQDASAPPVPPERRIRAPSRIEKRVPLPSVSSARAAPAPNQAAEAKPREVASELAARDPAEAATGLAETDGSPAEPGSGLRAVEAYEDLLSRRVQGCLRYPRRALRERIAGDADLTLTIRPDGELADASVDRSTGSSILDRDALETVRRCVPYPPPPARTGDAGAGRFAIRVGYDIR